MKLLKQLLPLVLLVAAVYVALIYFFGYHMPVWMVAAFLLVLICLRVIIGLLALAPSAVAVKKYTDKQNEKVQEARKIAANQFEHHDDDEPIHSL